jgi:hypothetical protein
MLAEENLLRLTIAKELFISWGLPPQLKEPKEGIMIDVDKIFRRSAKMAVRMADALIDEVGGFHDAR